MSRIYDDRESTRQAERAEQKHQEQKLRVDKKAADHAFSRLVNEGSKQQGQVHRQSLHRGNASESAAKLLEKADPFSNMRTQEDRERVLSQHGLLPTSTPTPSGERKPHAVLQELMGGKEGKEKAPPPSAEGDKGLAKKPLPKQGAEENPALAQALGQTAKLHPGSRGQAEAGKRSVSKMEGHVEMRSAESKEESKKHADLKAEAKEAQQAQTTQQGLQQASKSKVSDKEPREDFDRLLSTNPALMEPAPLVRPKAGGDSDRLRRLASEIAQKIVERIRVGTNKAGIAEFQIDLRSEVLSGLSLRVSASGGKINVVFSSADRNSLKTIEEQSGALRNALDVRGLTLTDLKLEMIS